jgi:hypothetical protein
MNTRTVRLVLGDLEAEVVVQALDLYLRTRPAHADRRYEYRYRAARAVLDSLRQDGERESADSPAGDDETVVKTRLWNRRNDERLED